MFTRLAAGSGLVLCYVVHAHCPHRGLTCRLQPKQDACLPKSTEKRLDGRRHAAQRDPGGYSALPDQHDMPRVATAYSTEVIVVE
jgi:hypothetical protein